MTGPYFDISDDGLKRLKARDKKLARFIDLADPIKRSVTPDPFQGLTRAIIGQQISGTALKAIWGRFENQFRPLEPRILASCSPEDLKSCGVSMRKAGYMIDLAKKFANGELRADELENMDDAALAEKLCQLNGVGLWTAQMLMIFTFQRPNIISYGDFGIRRGLRMLYGHKEITPGLFEKYKKRYHPHATLASLYLWEMASGKYVGYEDPLKKRVKGGGKPPRAH